MNLIFVPDPALPPGHLLQTQHTLHNKCFEWLNHIKHKGCQVFCLPLLTCSFLLPFSHFLCPYKPVAKASCRVCIAELQLSEHPSPIQQHQPAGLHHYQRARLKWKKRLSTGTAQLLGFWFPHRHRGDAHLGCTDRSIISCHGAACRLPWCSVVVLIQMTSVNLPKSRGNTSLTPRHK